MKSIVNVAMFATLLLSGTTAFAQMTGPPGGGGTGGGTGGGGSSSVQGSGSVTATVTSPGHGTLPDNYFTFYPATVIQTSNGAIFGSSVPGAASCDFKWAGGTPDGTIKVRCSTTVSVGGLSKTVQWPVGPSAIQEVELDFLGRWNTTITSSMDAILGLGSFRVIGSGVLHVYQVPMDSESTTREYIASPGPNPPPPGDMHHRRVKVIYGYPA